MEIWISHAQWKYKLAIFIWFRWFWLIFTCRAIALHRVAPFQSSHRELPNLATAPRSLLALVVFPEQYVNCKSNKSNQLFRPLSWRRGKLTVLAPPVVMLSIEHVAFSALDCRSINSSHLKCMGKSMSCWF